MRVRSDIPIDAKLLPLLIRIERFGSSGDLAYLEAISGLYFRNISNFWARNLTQEKKNSALPDISGTFFWLKSKKIDWFLEL